MGETNNRTWIENVRKMQKKVQDRLGSRKASPSVTAYHHKLVYDEAGLIVSERLTLSPRFPVNSGEAENPNGLSRETEPLVPLAKALDYAAALVAAERERCATFLDERGAFAGSVGAHFGAQYAAEWARLIREGD